MILVDGSRTLHHWSLQSCFVSFRDCIILSNVASNKHQPKSEPWCSPLLCSSSLRQSLDSTPRAPEYKVVEERRLELNADRRIPRASSLQSAFLSDPLLTLFSTYLSATSCNTITGVGNTGIIYRRRWGRWGWGRWGWGQMPIHETASSIPHPCILSTYAYVGMCKHGITVPGGPGIRYCFYYAGTPSVRL